ncbi:MAG TPA: FecR domain-containing protein [Rhizomicrobium sp.]|jgi:transmembrane sensor
MSDAQDKLDEAIAWHVRLNSGEADAKAWDGFTTWLEADDANRAAFDRVEELDGTLSALASELKTGETLSQFGRTPVRGSRRAIFAMGVFAALVLAIGVAYVARDRQPGAVEYATRLGETKSVRLADGTAVDLAAGTRLTVSERHVVLLQGEALFRVTPDPAHPFTVTVGDREVRDIGTVFDIQRYGHDVAVVVAEGEVDVRQHLGAQTGTDVHLRSGAKLTCQDGDKAVTVARVDPARALAWRDGYLVYENAALSEVVRDLNRHYPEQIAMADPSVAELKFSGVLKMDREDAVLERISRFLPVRVGRQSGGGFVLRGKAKGD